MVDSEFDEAALAPTRRALAERNWEAAARCARGVLQRYPGRPEVLFLLSRALHHMGAYDLAAELLLCVIHTGPLGLRLFHLKAALLLGYVRFRQGNPRDAMVVYLKICRHAWRVARGAVARRLGVYAK